MPEKHDIQIKDLEGKIKTAHLITSEVEKCYEFNFMYNDVDIHTKHEFPFYALQELRSKLEEHGIKIICEGSRYDVYPSGMSVIGFMAYETRMNEKATKMVYILDKTDKIEKIGTVKEQENYHKKWLESVIPPGAYQH